jgi:ABC-type glutathione transport system ATPase component
VEVIGLGKTYVSGGGWFRAERRVQAAKEVSFDIFRGETLGWSANPAPENRLSHASSCG